MGELIGELIDELIGRPAKWRLLIMRGSGHRGGMFTFVVLSGSSGTVRVGGDAARPVPGKSVEWEARQLPSRHERVGRATRSLLAMACRVAPHARLAVALGLLPDAA